MQRNAPGQSVTEAAASPSLPRPRDKVNPVSWLFTHPRVCGPVFVLPWFIGFLMFTMLPFLGSIVLSFLNWSMLGKPEWVGLDNYVKLFTADERYITALKNTVTYVVVTVPLKQIFALAIAMLLDQKLRGMFLYRSIFYLPSVTSGVATAILWAQIFGFRMGIVNAVLDKVGIAPIPWLTSIHWALPTLMLISLWNIGNLFIIYLAGLQGVANHYYEAAEVDGATPWQCFWKITVPLITPSIFFNVIMGFISTFQVFTQAYIMTGGGPADRTLFYVLYLWNKAFQDFRMGYAAAMAWVLFLIILSLTLFQMWLSRRWVYYEGASARGAGR